MMVEQLIRQNQVRHQELLREAEQSRQAEGVKDSSAASEALARTGDLLVSVGQGLQRRYRRAEKGVALAGYATGRGLGQSL